MDALERNEEDSYQLLLYVSVLVQSWYNKHEAWQTQRQWVQEGPERVPSLLKQVLADQQGWRSSERKKKLS